MVKSNEEVDAAPPVDVPRDLPACLPEGAVRQYLERNPEFFARHADLLESLSVPHACGPAESLIEHQVLLLRDRNDLLHRRLRRLVASARRNENTSERLHRLGLALLECRRPEDIEELLSGSLRAELGVDRACAWVSGEPEDWGMGRAQIESARLLGEVTDPICGELSPALGRSLLGADYTAGASGVLLPFSYRMTRGVLVIASREPGRFTPDMGTLFLERWVAFLARAVHRCRGHG